MGIKKKTDSKSEMGKKRDGKEGGEVDVYTMISF